MLDRHHHRHGLAVALGLAMSARVAVSSPALAQGKVLKFVPEADLRILDPITTTAYITRNHGYMVYDALFATDAKFQVQPQMVDKWEVSKDNLTYTFTLRKGVKFHDGTPFTADDVIFSWERASHSNSQLRQYAIPVGKPRKIDDYTVELTTSEPDAFLPLNLTNLFMASPAHWQKKFDAAPGAAPADKAKAAWIAFAADASGSGPFKMARFVPRERLEMVANKTYAAHPWSAFWGFGQRRKVLRPIEQIGLPGGGLMVLPCVVSRQVKFACAARNGCTASNAVEKFTFTQRTAHFSNHAVERFEALFELCNDQIKRLL